MKNRMPKLYDTLSPEALAALVVGATYRADSDDITALITALARQDRAGRDRYRVRRECLDRVVMLWANECLRIKVMMVALSAVIGADVVEGNPIVLTGTLLRIQKSHLAAYYAAMERFAGEFRLDMATITPLADANGACMEDLPEADALAVEKLLKAYREMVLH